MIMAEPVELLAKISRSAAQIILDAIAVHSQRGSRPGHQLGQAEGVLGRQRIGAIAAFANDHRIEQPDRNAVFARDPAHQLKKAGAPALHVPPPEYFRPIGKAAAAWPAELGLARADRYLKRAAGGQR